ncbi:type II secretion system F family protein [Alicyclobacillus sp.]|uniref:type II secretion system F family protein n=1 Tax=Alicyclobacillus sp. TaxID=61169 RepID=UPI0025C1C2CF|nr:type II secretion system F family protein [Alicyclobacillus sp.]MCL6516169.1 type II secretion system F family protein [Alicyclobacillus sp.]
MAMRFQRWVRVVRIRSGGRWCARLRARRETARVVPRLPDVFDHFAALSDAGLPIRRALRVLRAAARPAQAPYLDALAEALDAGQPLARVWAGRLPPLLTVLMEAGESTGRLADVLRAWSRQTRRRRAWRNELVRAAGYPAGLLVAVGLLSAFVQLHLFPVLNGLFAGLGFQPPASVAWARRAVVWVPLAGSMGLAASVGMAGVLWWQRSRLPDNLRRRVSAMPGAGLIRLWRTCTVSQLLALLIGAGIPLAEALAVLAGPGGPRWLRNTARDMRSRVLDGERLSDALRGEWDPVFDEFVTMAEETGDLAHAMRQVATWSERRLSARVERMLRALSPVLMSVMAMVVTAVMWSVFVPMYDIMDQVATRLV